jgi:hypothetical protein
VKAAPLHSRLSVLALAAALLAAAGCGDVDGNSQPFVGSALYQDPGGAYQIRLLEPPWVPIPLPTGETLFVVPPNGGEISLDESTALFSLHVSAVSGAPSDLATAATMGLPASAAVHTQTVHAAGGASGVDVSWTENATVFHRDAFLAANEKSTYRLHFTAMQSMAGDHMITQMIVSFVPLR